MYDIKSTTKNAPPLLAILMAMRIRRYSAEHIGQYGRSRATLDATGRRHQLIVRPISPGRRHYHQFQRKKISCGIVKLLFKASIQRAHNKPSTQLIGSNELHRNLKLHD